MTNKLKNLKTLEDHDRYWTDRAREIFKYVDRKDINFFAEMEKIYREQSVSLQKSVFEFYTRFAEDHEISYQDAMKQLRGEDLSDYAENARRYREQAEKDPELLRRLNEQYASARAVRLQVLNSEAVYRAGVLAGALHKSFEKYLYDVAEYAYRKSVGGRAGAINRPAFEEVIKTPFNGRNYSAQLWGNTDGLADSLKKVFRQGFIRGDSPQEMAREIRKEFNVARSRAETLIRTDATAVVNRATIKRYKREGLQYYRILVVLDDRTTQICRNIAQEDKLYKLEDAQVGVNMPPFHYNCRSTIMPDEEELNGDIEVNDNDFEKLKDDLTNLWDDISKGNLPYKSIERSLAESYTIGQLPSVKGTEELLKRVQVTGKDLAKTLEKHGTEFPLEQMLLLKELVANPDYVADNSNHHNNSVLLYKKVPERLKYLMEAALIQKDDGSYIIHYHKIKKQKLNKLKREQKILYSKDDM